MKEKFWYTKAIQTGFLYSRNRSLILAMQMFCLRYCSQGSNLRLINNRRKIQEPKPKVSNTNNSFRNTETFEKARKKKKRWAKRKCEKKNSNSGTSAIEAIMINEAKIEAKWDNFNVICYNCNKNSNISQNCSELQKNIVMTFVSIAKLAFVIQNTNVST